MSKHVPFNTLLNQTFINVKVSDDIIDFYTIDGRHYCQYHNQDCCEDVSIEDVSGDINDLIGYPILVAEESTSHDNPKNGDDEYGNTHTWTFYKLATIKGYVDIRWYGTSNGYYSESVDLFEVYNGMDYT